MQEMPAAVKRSIELLGLFIMGIIVIRGQLIIMPLVLAFFLALMVMPLFRVFRKIKAPELIAILLSILCITVIAILIGWLFYAQVTSLLADLPQIERNITRHLDSLSIWISKSFGVSSREQLTFINENSSKFFNFAESAIKGTVTSVPEIFIFFGLLPIYIFLVIWYRNLFLKFAMMWVKPEKHNSLKEVLPQLEKTVQHYLVGLLIQFTYIIILLGVSLILVGIKHGLLIGLLFAILNLIPYLGPLIGNVLGILITLASSDKGTDIFLVFGVITIVQFLDNNILMPRIVGSQVKINALVSILSIFVGGAIAGTAGMFLAMPVIAVLKILFERSEKFNKWAVLLGDNKPAKNPLGFRSNKRRPM
jgi:predicted PurR-regulated permease PerM